MTSGVYLRTNEHKDNISKSCSGKNHWDRVYCTHCGHKLIKKDGVWVHKLPHPEHVCRCDTPLPWTHEELIKARMAKSGISSFSGYVIKEFEYR
jgi:hypothetical protein